MSFLWELCPDISLDEENWRAQYGQVVKSEDEYLPAFSALDLWDWTMVTETMGKKKHQVARLIGRLARRSVKLHPSVPAGGGLLKTAAICDAHLDLVRVTSGLNSNFFFNIKKCMSDCETAHQSLTAVL